MGVLGFGGVRKANRCWPSEDCASSTNSISHQLSSIPAHGAVASEGMWIFFLGNCPYGANNHLPPHL